MNGWLGPVRVLGLAFILALSMPAQQPFSAAQDLFIQGDLNGAIAAAKEGLRLSPKSIAGLNLLGMIYGREGRFAEAEAAFEEALKTSPNSTATLNNFGNCYLLESKPELAEREFRRTLRLNPDDSTANYNLGTLLLSRGDPRAAVPLLERVQPADPGTLIALTGAYWDLGEKARSKTLAEDVSRQAGNNAQVHFSLGIALARREQYATAIRELERADVLMPDTFEILQNLGRAYLRKGVADNASEALKRALDRQPDSVPTLCLLAEAQIASHDYPKALQILARAHALDPKNTDVHFLLAQVSISHGLYAQAIPVLEAGLVINPGHPGLLAALAQSHFSAGRTDQAIAEFTKLVSLDPSAASYGFLGSAYQRLGRYQDAKNVLNRGLAKDRYNATCLYALGLIAEKEGNDAQAEHCLTEAVKSQSDFGDALYLLAGVKLREGRVEEAVPLLHRCIQADPRSARAYYRLATTERRTGHNAEASEDLRTFAALSRQRRADEQQVRQLFRALSRPAEPLSVEELERESVNHTNDPQFLCLLFEAYVRNGSLDKALLLAARFDQLSDAHAQLTAGSILAKYGHHGEAIQQFEKALKNNPEFDDAKYDLVLACIQGRQWLRGLQVAREQTPSEQNPVLLADLYMHTGHAPEAELLLRTAVDKNPENDQYIALLVLAQLQAGNRIAARNTLSAALRRIPDSGLLVWVRGISSAIAGEKTTALRDLTQSVDLLPEWRGAYRVLAAFYRASGENSKAAEIAARANELFGVAGQIDETSTDLLGVAEDWVDQL